MVTRTEVRLRPHDLVRLDIFGEQPGRNPSNWIDRAGRLHRVFVQKNAIRYHRADFGRPPWDQIAFVTAPAETERDNYPRICCLEEMTRIMLVLFQRKAGETGSNVVETRSTDHGRTWTAPSMSIPGGKWPSVSIDRDGLIIRSGQVGNQLHLTRQRGGEVFAGSLVIATNSATGLPLALANLQTHDIAPSPELVGRWILSVVIEGETTISEWESFDAGNSWRRIGA